MEEAFDPNHTVKEPVSLETNTIAPFSFEYVEKQLSKRNFGILSTSSLKGKPHSVGVVFGVSPPDMPFCLYVVSRAALKKTRNIINNPNVSFVVPIPHLLHFIPPSCIQFQGKAEQLPIDDSIANKVFKSSIVLRRSLSHSLELGESVFLKISPDRKIFCFGVGASIWQFIVPALNKKIKNFYVLVPPNRPNDL